jgi:hypothetical protein
MSYGVPGFDGATIRAVALLVDRHQTLWVGTESQGLYHIHDGHADHYGAAQGLTGDRVNSIYEDREGNLWITTDRGVDLFRDIPVARPGAQQLPPARAAGLNAPSGSLPASRLWPCFSRGKRRHLPAWLAECLGLCPGTHVFYWAGLSVLPGTAASAALNPIFE